MEEQLAEVVEACRFRLARGESVEQCLADYPDHAEELRSLLPVMARLPALRRDPDAAFLHSARQRFHARLAEARAGQRSPGGRA